MTKVITVNNKYILAIHTHLLTRQLTYKQPMNFVVYLAEEAGAYFALFHPSRVTNGWMVYIIDNS